MMLTMLLLSPVVFWIVAVLVYAVLTVRREFHDEAAALPHTEFQAALDAWNARMVWSPNEVSLTAEAAGRSFSALFVSLKEVYAVFGIGQEQDSDQVLRGAFVSCWRQAIDEDLAVAGRQLRVDLGAAWRCWCDEMRLDSAARE